jgi:Mrp family chromosome partitioning ATPase
VRVLGFQEDSPSTLRDYLEILRRGKWLILQAAIVIPVVAVLWSLRGETAYSASAGVLVNSQNFAANVEGLQDPTQGNPTRVVNSQVPVARLPEVARRTIAALGLRSWSPSNLLGESTVTTELDSDILTFTVIDGNSALAMRLANEYARQFTRYRLELDTKAVKSARRSVKARADALAAAGQQGSALYADLIETAQRLATLESLQTSRAEVVRQATGTAKLGPQPQKAGTLALALGLLLGVGLAFLREAVDTRVRSTDVVARELQLPLLGRLASPPRRVRRRGRLVTLAEPHGPYAEAYRMLAPNIELMNIEPQARVLMLTSAVEQEGKSTTAANLAVAFARAGKRVVLVDFDLHNPRLHEFFATAGAGVPLRPGLTEVVLGTAPLESALHEIEVRLDPSWAPPSSNGQVSGLSRGRLEVLPAGNTSAAQNLGGSFAFAQMLERLEDRADLVLLDAPPLLRTADALVASMHVHALLVVVRLNFIQRPMLGDLRRVLTSCPATKLGFVATGANAESGYGYLAYPYIQRRVSSSVEAGG